MQPDLFSKKYTIRQVKDIRIPLSDGIYLSADLFLPDASGKFPVVLNYIPYRKDDLSAYTGMTCHYFAERGFASAVVDIRGTGGSQGIILDEYTLQEQLDGCQVIDWLSKQEWSNGNVGMWGASYSGFNAIQIAMHNPPALKAIIPMYATDDRYNDDVHYYGGCLIGIEQVLYPAWMVGMNAMPPHAEFGGEDWIPNWRQHLDGNQPWLLQWFRHQTQDDYWLQGSLKRDYGLIKCPVYCVGGWADGYTNPVFRMLENLQVPHKALIGPWIHGSPSNGIPGPNIDINHEMCRWWAHWLRGEDTGIMDEPQVAFYTQHGAPPTPYESFMPGEWRYLDNWPVEGLVDRPFYLAEAGKLSPQIEESSGEDLYRYQATVGSSAGVWCAVNGWDSITRDQSADDGRSLTYTSQVLREPIEILGAPKAILHVSSTAEVSFFCVKVNDISPNGASRLVCRGILNATHRYTHSNPSPLLPGEVYELVIPLKYTSWVFQPGHRIRVSIASSDWPWVWPSPYPASNTVFWGSEHPSCVLLPVVEGLAFSKKQSNLIDIPKSQDAALSILDQPKWEFSQNLINGYTTLKVSSQGQGQMPGMAFSFSSKSQAEFGASDQRPGEAYAKAVTQSKITHIDGVTAITGRTAIRSTTTHFFIDVELKVERDGEPFYNNQWIESFPRNLI
jgi:putative CocE/NonD family hydrolase